MNSRTDLLKTFVTKRYVDADHRNEASLEVGSDITFMPLDLLAILDDLFGALDERNEAAKISPELGVIGDLEEVECLCLLRKATPTKSGQRQRYKLGQHFNPQDVALDIREIETSSRGRRGWRGRSSRADIRCSREWVLCSHGFVNLFKCFTS